jgi:perosamine synthetase
MVNIAKPVIGEEEQNAVKKVLESGMIACGATTKQFEDEFSKYMGVKHGIATTSGTTALEVAIKALGLGKGDKIITTTYSFIASTNAIIYSGATPVFVDIKEDTFNIDEDKLEEAFSKNPDAKALLIVHLFGHPCNMDKIMEFVKKHNLLLIEDCAQSHDAEWKGKKVGSFGDAAAYSFYPTKNMTTGEGGMVITNRDDVAENSRMLINHGMKVRYYHDKIGYNYRMTNMAAAIGLCQLEKLQEMNARRIANAAKYRELVKNEDIILPIDCQGHVYHQFTVRILNNRRDEFIKYLEKKEIGYGIFYPLTIAEQKCYQDMGFETKFPVADQIKTQVVSLPIHPSLTAEEIEYVANCLNEF